MPASFYPVLVLRPRPHPSTPLAIFGRNEIVFSSFFTGIVYALRYEDDADGKAGSLKWVLGKPDRSVPGFATWLSSVPHFKIASSSPTVAVRFQAAQHDANWVDAAGDQLLLFDNGAGHAGYNVDSRLMLFNLTARPTGAGNASAGVAVLEWDYFDPMAQKARPSRRRRCCCC